MSWYRKHPDRYKRDMSFIRSRFPDVVEYIDAGRVVLRGPFPVEAENGITLARYQLKIIFPDEYPNWIPAAYMREPGVDRIADRHMSTNGKACLCVPHETLRITGRPVTFENFHNNLLQYWLIGQAGYDRSGEWPLPARSHSRKGIIEGFAEITQFPTEPEIINFVRLLIRDTPAKGHEKCPCGSGQRLRYCHQDLYEQCRNDLPPQARKIYKRQF